MTRRKPHRLADDLTAGMQAIERLIASGKHPNEWFPARTIEIPDPSRSGKPATTPPPPRPAG